MFKGDVARKRRLHPSQLHGIPTHSQLHPEICLNSWGIPVAMRSRLRRARLRRKPSDEVLDEQLMQEVAITGYKQPVKGPGDLPSPAAKVTLDSIYSSMDDTSNK